MGLSDLVKAIKSISNVKFMTPVLGYLGFRLGKNGYMVKMYKILLPQEKCITIVYCNDEKHP